jgi:hypothetical protein
VAECEEACAAEKECADFEHGTIVDGTNELGYCQLYKFGTTKISFNSLPNQTFYSILNIEEPSRVMGTCTHVASASRSRHWVDSCKAKTDTVECWKTVGCKVVTKYQLLGSGNIRMSECIGGTALSAGALPGGPFTTDQCDQACALEPLCTFFTWGAASGANSGECKLWTGTCGWATSTNWMLFSVTPRVAPNKKLDVCTHFDRDSSNIMLTS